MRFFAIFILFTIGSCSPPVAEHKHSRVPEQQGHMGRNGTFGFLRASL
jgi:hypothetical protein